MSKSFRKDLTGQRFGRLTVLEFVPTEGKGTYWRCKCDCEKETVVHISTLRSGGTKSCGCFKKEATGNRARKHGKRETRIYTIWRGMRQRCYYPKNVQYNDYGGRGITVCDEWLHDFQAFYDWAMTNGYDGGLTLDRKDNDKGYSPENCRWANRSQQGRNKSTNVIVRYKEKKITIAEAAELTGISHKTLRQRYKRGDRGEKLFRPVKKVNK